MQFGIRSLLILMAVLGVVFSAIARAGFDTFALAIMVSGIHFVLLLVLVSPIGWCLRASTTRMLHAGLGSLVTVALVVLVCFAIAPRPQSFAVWSFWPGFGVSTAASAVGAYVGWTLSKQFASAEVSQASKQTVRK